MHVRAHAESLVDRRDNRRVIGEDARVISTNPDRKVNIRSIGNH